MVNLWGFCLGGTVEALNPGRGAKGITRDRWLSRSWKPARVGQGGSAMRGKETRPLSLDNGLAEFVRSHKTRGAIKIRKQLTSVLRKTQAGIGAHNPTALCVRRTRKSSAGRIAATLGGLL